MTSDEHARNMLVVLCCIFHINHERRQTQNLSAGSHSYNGGHDVAPNYTFRVCVACVNTFYS